MPNLRRISHFGSSPHTRGALHLMSLDGEDYGIIPAYAGSTSSAIMSSSVREDHPRIRGEHMRRWRRAGRCRGSSPHTRGARGGVLVDVAGSGIIPAYAGSTAVAPAGGGAVRDHPRIRGEHRKMRAMAGNLKGSSPHTRGAPSVLSVELIKCPDHPRIRGEHSSPLLDDVYSVGSSPHTRGAHRHRPPRRRRNRIIPAYAGSTVTPSTGSVTNTDHPRIRGEHVLQYVPTVGLLGSSPHTRGAHRQRRLDHQPVWIIPAYAGSTGRRRRRCRGRRDHPRIRGEHFSFLSQWCGSGGIIPAYAGSTPARRPHRTASADHPRIRGEHWAPSTHRPKP